jgi:hypothetical protein
MQLRRLAALSLTAVSFAGLSACGNDKPVTKGETEGVYVTVGDLKYQVQISRILNPADSEDRAYLKGLPASESTLPPDAQWFAVFMRVQNEHGQPKPTAERFTIVDTQANKFEPLPVDNVLAYQPETLQAKSILPDPNSVPAYTPTQGTLLLFKIPNASLDNRPLDLEIEDPSGSGKQAVVRLDI